MRARKDKVGIVIVGHGSKKKCANNALFDAVKFIRGNGFRVVEPAFLQLSRPTLNEGARRAIKKGCNRIIIAPFFLFAGNHVARDIPARIDEIAKGYNGIDFICAKSLGKDPRIGQIVLDNLKEAMRP